MLNWHVVFYNTLRVHEDGLTPMEKQLNIGYPILISMMNPKNGLQYKMHLYKTYFIEDIRLHQKIFYTDSCPWDGWVISSIRESIRLL